MDYTAFEISNFKGIRQLRFDLDSSNRGRITTLVGLNESGKTTILEAIDLFAGGSADLDPQQLYGRIRPAENDLIPISERANFNGDLTIEASVRMSDAEFVELKSHLRKTHDFRLADADRDFTVADVYTYASSSFKGRKTVWSFTGAGRAKGERKDWRLNKQNYPEIWSEAISFIRQRLPAIWYFPNFLFDFPSKIYLAELPDETSADTFYRVLVQDILDSLQLDVTVEEHLSERALSGEASDRRSLDNLVLRMGRKITEDVFSGWNRMFGRQVDKKVVLRVDVEERVSAAGAIARVPYIEFQIEDNDGFFYVHERSLGFRWFFVFLLLTSFRGARKGSDSGLVFLFDEPASNLHPSAQEQLRSSFPRLVERCRIIYTTHSHHMIDPDWLEQTYVVRNRGLDTDVDLVDYTAKRTDIAMDRYRNFAAQHPDQSRYFQPILDVLDYAPSKLELVPAVVMVEGKNDYYTARLAQALIAGSSDLQFMPGGGAGTLDQLIALYMGWGREFVVLLDSDGEGDRQKARYIDKFGLAVMDRVFTLGDLAPSLSGKSLEAAFSESDRAGLVASLGGDPARKVDKNTLNRMIQEALIRSTQFQFSPDAQALFAALMAEIETRMESLRRG